MPSENQVQDMHSRFSEQAFFAAPKVFKLRSEPGPATDERALRELLSAANDGDLNRVQLSLANPNIVVNSAGGGAGMHPALHLAALRGHTKVIELLVAKGAHVDQQADFDETPLHLACYNNHKGAVEALLRAGAGTELKSKAGWTPLFWTCTNCCPEALVKLMLAGADINAVTTEGWTPLHKACEYGLTFIVKALLRAGAKDDAMTIHGESPLDIGIARGHAQLAPIFDRARRERELRDEERKARNAAKGSLSRTLLVKLQKTTRITVAAARRRLVDDPSADRHLNGSSTPTPSCPPGEGKLESNPARQTPEDNKNNGGGGKATFGGRP